MLVKEISPGQSGFYPKIILDYISGVDKLTPFYSFPHQFDSFALAIKNRLDFPAQKRIKLVNVLKEQYSALGLNEKNAAKSLANIHSLEQPDTFTVTTGHQLCLFTGPLYFIYKILHTIKLSQELKQQYPQYNFVPVFWLASEDQDFDEVKSVHLFGKTYSWNIDSRQQPVGRLSMSGMEQMLDEMGKVFEEQKVKSELFMKMKSIYQSSKNLSEATRRIVHHLFGEYGLVVMEPDDAVLKQELIPVMEQDILHQKSFTALFHTNELLHQEHYKLQVNGREVNFFYLSEEGRRLVTKQGEKYSVKGTGIRFTQKEMEEEIRNHPERFSPNVVLRPVYQETILPNLAYIGGPGELAYWLQLKTVFETHGVHFPILLLRNSFAIIEAKYLHKLIKTGADPASLFLNKDALTKALLQAKEPTNEISVMSEINESFQKLIDAVSKTDNQIGAQVIEQKKKLKDFLNKVKTEMNARKRSKYENDLVRLQEVKQTLFTNKAPQERIKNILEFALDNQAEHFLRPMLAESSAITGSVKLIQL